MSISNFILQSNIYFKEIDENKTRFEISPLNRGFGYTLGNIFRRILMSSVPGAAIVSAKFSNVNHEFSTIKGVKDDVLTMILRLKQIRMKVNSDLDSDDDDSKINLYLEKKGKGKIVAGDFDIIGDAEIVNKNLVITELTDEGEIEIECISERGFGYLPVENRSNEDEDQDVNFFAIDAIFNPVLSVKYYVEDTRVGQMTNLDKLILEIETDGTLTPKEALLDSLNTLSDYSKNLLNASENIEPMSENKESTLSSKIRDNQLKQNQIDIKSLTIEEIGLSPRTQNALKNNNVNTVKDLIGLGKSNISDLKGVGSKSLREIFERLEELGIKIS